MTNTTGSTRTGRGRTRHVLVADHQGRLTLRRLRPWHRMLARILGTRLDRELASGTTPEASASLAARAIWLTSGQVRRDLAASIQRILAAAGQPLAVPPLRAAGAPPHVRFCRARVSRSAPELAELAGHLTRPGPVPVQGVAMVSQFLADGTGPLYHQACRDDLAGTISTATRALTV